MFLEDGDYERTRTLLNCRYGMPYIIARYYIDSLVYGAQINGSDINRPARLFLETQYLIVAVRYASDIENSENRMLNVFQCV